MLKRYPRTLSSGANNTVIALSETEVGKLFTGDTRSDIGSETEKMKFANIINDLVVKFIRLDFILLIRKLKMLTTTKHKKRVL